MKGKLGMSLNRHGSPLKVIGLTGGIGSGKSTAAEILISMGFAHIDADEIGRNLTKDDGKILPVLLNTFGSEIFLECTQDHLTLDRQKTAETVFTDKSKLKIFNEIMFTEIIGIIKEQIAAFNEESGEKYCGIILDAPLLYESGADSLCDKVILITAAMEKRIERVCQRDETTEGAVRRRIESQMNDDEKRLRADYIIDNSGGIEELKAQIEKTVSAITS